MIGYGHVFVGTMKNDDPANAGSPAIAGTNCNPSSTNQPGDTCLGGAPKYRTNWPVNLGTITNAINVINVGAAYRF